MTEEAKSDRLTLRLPARELEQLRELAKQRRTDLASLGREAISTYLKREQGGSDEHAATLVHEVTASVKREADRVIERHEKTTRALIAALNEHLAGKP
jgi:predicted transcriptional regulator